MITQQHFYTHSALNNRGVAVWYHKVYCCSHQKVFFWSGNFSVQIKPTWAFSGFTDISLLGIGFKEVLSMVLISTVFTFLSKNIYLNYCCD